MAIPVLVSGGAGYIGSHLCKALAAKGYLPIAYDSLQSGHKWAVKWGPLVEGCLLDAPLLTSTLKKFEPVAVFHLASLSNPRQSHLEALSYYKNNLIGTYTLLEAIAECHIPYFLFSSSASVYGKKEKSLLAETDFLAPLHPYGRTKLAAEMMIADFCKAHSICYANLRYFNAAGADPDGELGETHNPETHLIPLLIQVLKGKKENFSLLGQHHPTHDGTAERDYIHVSDLADAHINALEWLKQEKKDITLNLGSGVGHTILDIISRMEAYSGKKTRIIAGPQVEEASSLVADVSLAKSLLNWNPMRSNLDLLIETAWRWDSL